MADVLVVLVALLGASGAAVGLAVDSAGAMYVGGGMGAAVLVAQVGALLTDNWRVRPDRGLESAPADIAAEQDEEENDVPAAGGPDGGSPTPSEASRSGDGKARRAIAAEEDGDSALLVAVLDGGRRFHDPGCVIVAGKPADHITLAEALEEGFTACTRCQDARPARSSESSSSERQRAHPSKPETN